jgi:hypothetical protein
LPRPNSSSGRISSTIEHASFRAWATLSGFTGRPA